MKFILVLVASLILSVLVFAQTSTSSTKMQRKCTEDDNPRIMINVDVSGNITADGEPLFIFKTTTAAFKDRNDRVYFEKHVRWDGQPRSWVLRWIPLCGNPVYSPSAVSSYFRRADRSLEDTQRKGMQIVLKLNDYEEYGLYTYQGAGSGTASNLWEKARIAPPVISLPASGVTPGISKRGGSVWGGP
jgi:hypothetical protein